MKTVISDKYLMKKDLHERGWTLAMIDSYMPKHCKFHNEKWHTHRDRIKVYSLDRVEKIESTPEFQIEFKKLQEKRAKIAARKASTA